MDISQEDSTLTHVTERTVIDQSKTSVTGTVKKSNVSDSSVVKQENRDKFKPNKDLKSTAIPDGLPRPSIESSPLRGQGSHERSSMDERDADLSSAKIPSLKNQEAQVVEFSKSAKLLEEQKKHAEALVAKQAAERLTERLHIQMGDFIPEVQQVSNRGGEIDMMMRDRKDEIMKDRMMKERVMVIEGALFLQEASLSVSSAISGNGSNRRQVCMITSH
nr:uncharacterized protein LOC129278416 [Lytechinus pictus]